MSLYVTQSGRGVPLILLHGLFGMGENLAMIARPLSEQFTVYTVDLRNHGRSFHADSMTFAEMADDVLALMDELQLQQVSLLGHSLGGKVAMQLALSQPARVSKLVVADIAPVAYGGEHNAIFTGLKSIVPATLASRREADLLLQPYVAEAGVRQFLLKNLYKNPADQFAWRFNLTALERCYEQLRQGLVADKPYDGPCLFIKGELSAYIQHKHRSAIEALFPLAELKIIQGTGHWLHAEKPQLFTRLVEKFLS